MDANEAGNYYRKQAGLPKSQFEKSPANMVRDKVRRRKLRGYLLDGVIHIRTSDIDMYLRETTSRGKGWGNKHMTGNDIKKSPYKIPQPATYLNVTVEERVRARLTADVKDGKTLSWVANKALKEHFNMS